MNAGLQAEGRDLGLDAIKAFATILVIVGHVIQYTTPDFDNSILFRVIYSFHMPLFMFISGYLIRLDPGRGKADFLAAKFMQLVVPFLLWSVLLVSLENFAAIKSGGAYVLLDRLYQVVLRPDNGGLWFLWVLFLNFLVFTVLVENYRISLSLIIIVALSLLQLLNRDFSLFGLGLFRWHYFFFLCGFWAGSHGLLNKIKINIWVVLAITVLFLTQWERVVMTSFFGHAIKSNALSLLVTLAVKYLCALGAIIVIFLVKEKVKPRNWWVRMLSTESLGYYATQRIFLLLSLTILPAKGSCGVFLYQFLVFSITFIGCTLVITLLKRYPLASKYLLGRSGRKKWSRFGGGRCLAD